MRSGMMAGVTEVLHHEVRGEGPCVLLLHGFTRTGASWAPLAEQLASRYTTVTCDVRGHGRSPARAGLSIESLADDVAALLDALGVERAALVGYSMGGRLALATALRHPGRVGALVLESASPGIADPAEREARRVADERLAAWMEARPIDEVVARWESQPLFAAQSEEARTGAHADRLRNDPAGLAASLRGMGTGTQPSYWRRLDELGAPCLLITGGEDAKFTAVARRMLAALPGARLEVVPGAGHAVHEDAPEQFAAAATAFLASAMR